MFIWDGEKAVEDKGKKKPKEPELIWDGEKPVPKKKEPSTISSSTSSTVGGSDQGTVVEGGGGLRGWVATPEEELKTQQANKAYQDSLKKAGQPIVAESTKIDTGRKQAEIKQYQQDLAIKQANQEVGYAEKAIAEGKSLEDMAAIFKAEQDPKFKAQLDKLQESEYLYEQPIADVFAGKPSVPMKNRVETIFGEATRGQIMFNFISNPRVQEAVKKNPQLAQQVREEAGNLINHYPEFGKMYLGNVISQKMEEMGINNGIVNSVTKGELDQVVSKLKEEGQLNEAEISFINKEIRPRMGLENFARVVIGKPGVKTTGAIENAVEGAIMGARNLGQGVAEFTGIRGALQGDQGALSTDLERDARKVSVKPVGLWHEITQTGGQTLGQALAIGGGAKALASAGIKSPALALGLAGGIQAYGNYAPEARKMFPDNKLKQRGYATIMSGIEALTENIFRDTKVLDGLMGNMSPVVKKAIQNYTSKNITAAAAKQAVQNALQEAVSKAGKSLGENIGKNVLEEVAAGGLGDITSGVFEGKPVADWVDIDNLSETARQALLGSVFIGALATRADMKNKQGVSAKQIYLMARDPEYWAQQIRESNPSPEDANDVQDKLGNLEYSANLLKELDTQNLTEKQKAKYLLASLANRSNAQSAPTATDDVLRRQQQKEIDTQLKDNEKIKEDILSGKDDGSFEGDKSDDANTGETKLFDQIYKAAPEGYKATLESAKSQGNILGGLDYMKDKFAENPIKFREDFGDEIADKVLSQTPTENIQEKLDYLIENNTDDPNINVLDKIIADRESKTVSDEIAEPDNSIQYKETLRTEEDADGTHDVITYDLMRGGETIGEVEVHKYKDKGHRFSVVELNKELRGKGIGKEIYRDANRRSLEESGLPLWTKKSELNENSERMWQSLIKSGDAEVMPDGNYKFKDSEQAESGSNKTEYPSLRKQEIDVLPENEKEAAIDSIIYGVKHSSNKDAFSREDGTPVTKGTYNLSKFLKENEVTGDDVSKNLLNNISKHPYFDSVKLYVTDRMDEKTKGEAIYTAGIMKVSPKVDARTMAHEMMHFLTAKIFVKEYDTLLPSEKNLRNGVNGIIKQFDPDLKYLDSVLGKLGYKRSEYAQEIIAEAFTGSWFAKELEGKQVKVIRTRRIDKNLIQKIVDKIISFFGGQISDKVVKSEDKISAVQALKEVFSKYGSISADRLREINVPTGKYDSLKSREVNGVEAAKRMREAGFSEDEIKAEFAKRGIKYEKEQPPISEPPKKSRIYVERPATELSHKGLQDVANEFSLPDVQKRDRKSDVQLRQDAVNTMNDWLDKKEYPQKIEGLVKKAEAGEILTDEQRVILEQHLANLSDELRNTPKDSPEFDTKLAKIKRLKDAGEKTRSEAGAALRIPTFRSRPQDLADYYVAEMEAAGVDVLTDKQKETAAKEFNDITEAEKAYQQKIAALEEENARLKAEQTVKATAAKTKKGQKKDFKAERTKILDDIKAKLNKPKSNDQILMAGIPFADKVGAKIKTLVEISPDVAKLMKSYVEQGITELAVLVKNIHSDLKDGIPDITETDIRDLIAGKYSEKRTQDQLAAQLRDLRTEAKYVNELEALEKEEEPKSERKKIERNQKIADLKKKIKDHDLSRLADYKKRVQADIEKIEEQLKTGDFAKPEAKPLKLDKEAQELKDKLIKLKEQRTIRLMKEDYEKRSKAQKAMRFLGQIASIPRVLKSSFDVSMPFRQGIWGLSRQLLTLPIGSNKDFHVQKSMIDQFKKMYQAVGHEKYYRRAMADIKDHPRFAIAEKAGLKLADPNSELQEAREEMYGPNIVSKYIPFFGRPIAIKKDAKGEKTKIGGLTQISERSATMFVNQMKWDVFNNIVDVMESNGKTIENAEEDYKQAANYANKVVGRGVLGKKVENIGYVTSRLFFSLRLMASRLQLLTDVINPYFYYKAPKEVRQAYWKDYIKFVALSGTALLLARAAGGDVEDEPTSSDAGKIRVGRSRYDILGGFGQYGVLGSRMVTGETTSATTGKTRELGSGRGQKSRAEVLISFLRSKSSPEAGFAWNVLQGKDAIGQPTSLGEETKDLFTPLMYQDIQEAFKDQSVAGALLTTLLVAHGVGYGSYDAPKK